MGLADTEVGHRFSVTANESTNRPHRLIGYFTNRNGRLGISPRSNTVADVLEVRTVFEIGEVIIVTDVVEVIDHQLGLPSEGSENETMNLDVLTFGARTNEADRVIAEFVQVRLQESLTAEDEAENSTSVGDLIKSLIPGNVLEVFQTTACVTPLKLSAVLRLSEFFTK